MWLTTGHSSFFFRHQKTSCFSASPQGCAQCTFLMLGATSGQVKPQRSHGKIHLCCGMLHHCWGLGAQGFWINATRPHSHRRTFLEPTKHAQAGQKSLESLHVSLLHFTFHPLWTAKRHKACHTICPRSPASVSHKCPPMPSEMVNSRKCSGWCMLQQKAGCCSMPQHGGILCWFPLTPCIPKLMPQMTLFFSASAFFFAFCD